MTEENEILSQFGNEFIKNARDRTLKIYDKLTKSEMKSKDDLALSKKIKSLNFDDKLVMDDVVYEMVDLALFNILNFLEERTQIEYEDANLNAITDDLAGELYSDEGWIKKFSAYNASEK
ncbi:hypothetical protein [Acinetobacter higginsii]|uniref:hypothetical protein n=1 Tax=Acinetobacter higginsii TaxID=70347 RepID=UPI00300B11D7